MNYLLLFLLFYQQLSYAQAELGHIQSELCPCTKAFPHLLPKYKHKKELRLSTQDSEPEQNKICHRRFPYIRYKSRQLEEVNIDYYGVSQKLSSLEHYQKKEDYALWCPILSRADSVLAEQIQEPFPLEQLFSFDFGLLRDGTEYAFHTEASLFSDTNRFDNDNSYIYVRYLFLYEGIFADLLCVFDKNLKFIASKSKNLGDKEAWKRINKETLQEYKQVFSEYMGEDTLIWNRNQTLTYTDEGFRISAEFLYELDTLYDGPDGYSCGKRLQVYERYYIFELLFAESPKTSYQRMKRFLSCQYGCAEIHIQTGPLRKDYKKELREPIEFFIFYAHDMKNRPSKALKFLVQIMNALNP